MYNGNQYLSPILADGNDNFFIPWTDYRNENTSKADIYGQLINLDGEVQWKKDGMALVQEDQDQYLVRRVNELLPISVSDGKGEIYLTWIDMRNINDTSYDIYLKRLPAPFTGELIIEEFIQTIYGIGSLIYILLLLIIVILLVFPSKNKRRRRK